MIYAIVQIIIAIILVFMLLFVAYVIYNYEYIINMRNANSIKKEIIVFDGIADFRNVTSWSYNTYNKQSVSFKDLTPSINQNGGAEYSYNFWLYVDRNELRSLDSSSTDYILLLRGSKNMIPYINNKNCQLRSLQKYILVKNPLIRIKSDASAIIVEYNTITNPDAFREYGQNAIDCNSNSWKGKNKGLLGIYNMDNNLFDKKWFMITVVLKEINPDNDILYKNKTTCKMYINGINILDRVVESPYNTSYGSAAMKHNRGFLFINPGDFFNNLDENHQKNPFDKSGNAADSEKNHPIRMANLSYYNYALAETDIYILFQKKFTKKAAVPPVKEEDISGKNMFDISPMTDKSNNLPLPF